MGACGTKIKPHDTAGSFKGNMAAVKMKDKKLEEEMKLEAIQVREDVAGTMYTYFNTMNSGKPGNQTSSSGSRGEREDNISKTDAYHTLP